jgi:hypothetical protein
MIFTNSQGYEYQIRLVGGMRRTSSRSITSGSIIKTGQI